MPVYVKTYFNPLPLKAKIAAAFRAAASDTKHAAEVRCDWNHVRSSLHLITDGHHIAQVRSSAPDAIFLEKGTRPHEIAPKGKVLKFPDGTFASGSVPHPGTSAHPFLKPASELFPTAFRLRARAVLH